MNTPVATRVINNRIAELKAKISELTKGFYNQGKPINFYSIERELLRKGDRALVNDYFRKHLLDATAVEGYFQEISITEIQAKGWAAPGNRRDTGVTQARFQAAGIWIGTGS